MGKSTLADAWGAVAARHGGHVDHYDAVYALLRCKVCQRRDWSRGGSGRSDLLGDVMIRPGPRTIIARRTQRFSQATTRKLAAAGVSLDDRGREVMTDGRHRAAAEDEVGARDGIGMGRDRFDGSRWKCRHGHRLRADERDVLEQVARSRTPATAWGRVSVYLEAA